MGPEDDTECLARPHLKFSVILGLGPRTQLSTGVVPVERRVRHGESEDDTAVERRYPRPSNGMLVALMVIVNTFVSSGRLAM